MAEIDGVIGERPERSSVELDLDCEDSLGHDPLPLSDEVCDAWEAPPKVRTWDWIKENSHTHKGQPFNYMDFPWCEGICDAWDNPGCRRIFFRAGSRLGKTEISLAMHQCAQHHDPDIGMIGASTEMLLMKTLGDRYYGMLEKTPPTKDQCPPKHRRNKRKVTTRSYIIYGAWSGSATTLGDIDPKYVNLLEASKWTKDNSEEADPLDLAMERGAEIPDRKLMAESTPTIKGKCRISRYVEQGTDRRYHIPCPHCNHYDELHVNKTKDPKNGGLWWDRDKDGEATGNVAESTARYVCGNCHKEWADEFRRPAVMRGIWVARGQHVDADGVLQGEPDNAGPDESFTLSRMYGATFSFGAYARAYVEQMGTESEQSFLNNWEGVCYIPVHVDMKWETLADRLCRGEWQHGLVPAQCYFVTTAIDVQYDHFVCAAMGWDNQRVGYLVRHGIAHTWSEVKDWTHALYRHEDGGRDIPSIMNLIDAKDGNRTSDVIANCQDLNCPTSPWVWPSMGMKAGSMQYRIFKNVSIGKNNEILSQKTRKPGIHELQLTQVNTNATQSWLDNCMYNKKAGKPHSLVFNQAIAGDQDLMEQMLNEAFDPEKGLWVRVDESTIPVDYRDVMRYNRCAAESAVNGNWDKIPAFRPRVIDTESDRHRRQEKEKQKKASAQDGNSFVRKPEKTGRFIRRRS